MLLSSCITQIQPSLWKQNADMTFPTTQFAMHDEGNLGSLAESDRRIATVVHGGATC